MEDRKLTKKEVEHTKPREKGYRLSDVDGFYLVVRPSGGKL